MEYNFIWTCSRLEKMYIIPLKCCLSTKLRYFQFRILHRILGVNKYLHSIGISDSNLCTFCSSSVESISHLFWECPVTHQFIQDLQTSILNNEVLLNKNAFLFGFPDGRRSSFNFVILYAKYFIFTAKCKQERLSLNSFKNMLKRVNEVERVLYTKQNKFIVWLDRWRLVQMM